MGHSREGRATVGCRVDVAGRKELRSKVFVVSLNECVHGTRADILVAVFCTELPPPFALSCLGGSGHTTGCLVQLPCTVLYLTVLRRNAAGGLGRAASPTNSAQNENISNLQIGLRTLLPQSGTAWEGVAPIQKAPWNPGTMYSQVGRVPQTLRIKKNC